MQKKYKCKKCGHEVYIRCKGLCPSCRSKELPTKTVEKKDKSGLNSYFDYHIQRLSFNPYSENSGIRIINPSRFNICHIFPKRIYKSIQDHKHNVIYLTIDEHTLFDSMMDGMEFDRIKEIMPILWNTIESRIKEIMPLITETSGKLFVNLNRYF